MKHVKTRCVHCRGKIEFPAHGVGEWIECPHCSETTVLRKRNWFARPIFVILLIAAMGITAACVYEWRQDTLRAQADVRETIAADLARLDSLEFQLSLAQREREWEQIQTRKAETQRFFRPEIDWEQRAAQRREQARHDEIVSEMQEANRIANDALWNARRQPAPVFPRTITIEKQYDPMESWRQFEQQQALQGIEYELRQLRWDHRPRYY